MADLTYDIKVNASDAERNLKNLQTSVGGLSTAFDKLKVALAGIAFGAAISNALQYADAISDLSDATGIAIQNIIGFGKAVQANGGDTETAQKGILKLVQTIGDAANGSLEAQNAFADVGVSLRDLKMMSEQDILAKAIKGLGNITSASEQATLKAKLFGKEFRKVAVEDLGNSYETATQKSLAYAASVKSAAQVQDRLDESFGNFKIALLDVLKPISDLAKDITANIETTKTWIKTLLTIAAVVVSFTLIGNIIKGISALLVGLSAAGETAGAAFLTISATLASTGATVGRFGIFLRGILADFFAWLGVIASSQVKLIDLAAKVTGLGIVFQTIGGIMAGVGATIVLWWDDITKAIGGAYDKALAFFGINNKTAPKEGPNGGAGRGGNAETLRLQQQQGEAMRREAEAAREVVDALAKRRQEIEKTAKAFQLSNADQIAAIDLDRRLVGQSEQLAEIERARAEIQKRTRDEVQKLRDAKAALSKDEQGLAGTYDSQIAKVQALGKADEKRLISSITGLQSVKMLEEFRIKNLENLIKATEDAEKRSLALGDAQRSIIGQQKDIEFQRSTIGMGEMEKQIANIQENARKSALEAGRAYAQAFEDTGDGMTPEKAQEFADGLAKITEGYKAIADAQIANVEASRTWEAGWKEAFKNYVDDATNAATMAKDVFSSMTSNMNSALDKFVETGKLNFGDLARSIILDLLKIQLKKAAAGFVGSLFGFANGGSPPVGRPSIVGERGPELFVPNVAGKIIPNNQLGSLGGGGAVVNHYTYNNNVTAMDAKSVAQLFYDNRHTMFGTVEAAKKEMPMRR